MTIRKFLNRHKFISLGIILAVGVSTILLSYFAYSHFLDYDIAPILKNPKQTFVTESAPNSSLSQIKHVFVIVEENKDWSDIYQNPEANYINHVLLPQGSFAKNYHNTPENLSSLHPSEPNYILLEAGRIAFPDHTFTTDNDPSAANSTNSTDHLSFLLDKNNYSWRVYEEGISGQDCPITSFGDYAAKHNPFVFFKDISGNPPNTNSAYCIQHIRPLSEMKKDLSNGDVANYTFVTPNIMNDMHNGSIKEGDTWLSQEIPLIMNSQAYKNGGAIFITWDEGNGGSDVNPPIGMIILSPFVKQNYSNNISYSHASFVKTVENIFHLNPLLGLAANPTTKDLADFFK